MTRPTKLPFTVDGQLVGELGQRLVTRNHVALAELIKNSYDADANEVEVSFEHLSDPNGISAPSIKIVDNGLGMAINVIENNWMRIATSNKLIDSISSLYGRPRTGSKGIGRFSCERLAKHLYLSTTAEIDGELQTTEAWFNWDDFKPGANLADIRISFSRSPKQARQCGTVLHLVNLRDDWTQAQFETLARAVMSLTITTAARREKFKPDPGFSLHLHADNFETPEPDLFERMLDAGWARMTGSISSEGEAKLQLKGKYLDRVRKYTFQDRHPNLAGLNFDIAFIRGGHDDNYDLNRDTKTLTKKLLSEIQKGHAGVRVYFEGFRVYPYGEPENDWLSLDKDYAVRSTSFESSAIHDIATSMGFAPRDVGLIKPRNANLLGRVYLDKQSASSMTTKISREGFTDSASLRHLVAILRTGIEWATVYFAYAKEVQNKQQKNEAEQKFSKAITPSNNKPESDDGKGALNRAIEFLAESASSSLPSGDTTPIKQHEKIELAQSVIATNFGEKEQEISRLRTLASTAPLLFTFNHEVSSLISQLDTHANSIKQMAKLQASEKDKISLDLISQDLKSTGKNFRAVASLFGVLSTTKDTDQKRHYAKPLIEGLIQGTTFALTESAIGVNFVCDRDLKTPRMKKAEFVSIAVNLYINSLKSTMASKGNKIEIRCFNDSNNFILEITDDGVGLAKRHRSTVFDPFISDPEQKIYSRISTGKNYRDLASFGQGSGLGLSIVKGIVDSRKGSATFFDEKGWKIGVRVTLPRT